MASNLPMIQTPDSPSDDDTVQLGLGVSNIPQAESANVTYDPNALSPTNQHFRFGSMSAPMASPASVYSSMSVDSSGTKSGKSEEGSASPFNFQTTTLAKSPVVKSVRTPIGPPPKGACSPVNKRVANLKPEQNIGQRRGHKYKHSSVSHQIFQEPPVRAPQTLPNSLPIPTFAECRGSMSKEQKTRFYWCLCHMFVAAYILWSAHGSLAMTALSHLLFYDSLGALLCVVVDVLSNFEVWKRSSLRHPFGLERVEVLAGFAMSVLLAFMGADLLSHNFKHATEGMGHESHRAHAHDRVSPGAIDLTVLLAIGSTLVSAIGLKNHARIGKATRFGAFESLPSVLSNPSHFLTLSCSTLLLLLPLLSLKMYSWMDKALSCSMAIAMIILGFRLVKALGSMLLMSYSGSGVQDVILDIENDPSVSRVEDAKFWQVHYGLCMANLKLRANGTEENLLRLRERISSLVRNRLAGGYGTGNGQKWEVTVQFVPEDN